MSVVVDDRHGGKTYHAPTTHLGQNFQIRRIRHALGL
jgi:hypothetical protein